MTSHAELQALAPALEAHPSDFILQPLIEGGEEQIVSYHAYVDEWRRGRRLHRPQGPHGAARYGFSSYVQVTDDERVRQIGRDVVKRLGFRGLIKLDLKEDRRDGGLYLLEANPRFNLWHHPGADRRGEPAGDRLLQSRLARVARAPTRSGARRGTLDVGLRGPPGIPSLRRAPCAALVARARGADVVEDLCWSDPVPGVARLAGRLRPRVGRGGAARAPAQIAAEG